MNFSSFKGGADPPSSDLEVSILFSISDFGEIKLGSGYGGVNIGRILLSSDFNTRAVRGGVALSLRPVKAGLCIDYNRRGDICPSKIERASA